MLISPLLNLLAADISNSVDRRQFWIKSFLQRKLCEYKWNKDEKVESKFPAKRHKCEWHIPAALRSLLMGNINVGAVFFFLNVLWKQHSLNCVYISTMHHWPLFTSKVCNNCKSILWASGNNSSFKISYGWTNARASVLIWLENTV